jgi:hypothetical protein
VTVTTGFDISSSTVISRISRIAFSILAVAEAPRLVP